MPETSKSSVYFANAISKISSENSNNDISLKEFLEITEDRGRLIVCMILATPFLIPISIPGSSIPFGIGIMFIGISLIFNRPLIPEFILEYRIKKETVYKILKGSISVLNKFEKVIKPRVQFTMNNYVNILNSILLVFSAFLLMLPIPIPLTDTLPAYSIFLLSAGILERDGYLIIISYALIIITAVYFGLIIVLGFEAIYIIASYFGISLPRF